jgi:hypothetical protein
VKQSSPGCSGRGGRAQCGATLRDRRGGLCAEGEAAARQDGGREDPWRARCSGEGRIGAEAGI